MLTRKQMYSLRDERIQGKLNDYIKWVESKQKQLSIVRRLTRQYDELARENVFLQDKNKEVSDYRYKYYSLKPNNINEREKALRTNYQSLNFRSKQYLQKHQKRIESSQRKFGFINRNKLSSPSTARTSIKQMQSQSKLNSQIFYSARPKNFNYCAQERNQEQKIKHINGSFLNKKDNNKKLSIDNYQKVIKQVPRSIINARPIILKDKKQQDPQISEKINEKLEVKTVRFISSQQNCQRVQNLEQQVQELKQIQSKLIDRIYERDIIIEELQKLLATKISNYKDKEYKDREQERMIKQNDKDTIDSTIYTPKKF